MTLVFLESALSDLAQIENFYRPKNSIATDKILTDVFESCDQLNLWPMSGHIVEGEPGRRITTGKFGFTITHKVENDDVYIVGIFRYQDRSG